MKGSGPVPPRQFVPRPRTYPTGKEFVERYFTERGKDWDDWIKNAPNDIWISDVIREFHNAFITVRSPIIRLAIVHFLDSHREIQKMIDKQIMIIDKSTARGFLNVDNLLTILDNEQRRQRAIVFRGVSSASGLVRRDSLALMRAVDAMNSRDPDVVRSASDMLKRLCCESKDCCKAVLKLVKMPHLLRFLPDMTHSRKLQNRAVGMFVQFMNRDCPFLRRLLKKSMDFVANIEWFHSDLFDQLIELLSGEPDIDLYCFCCDLISNYVKYLYPEQIGWLGRFAVDFLHSVALEADQQSLPLKLLMNMNVTTPRLYDIEPLSLMNVGYLIACFPRTQTAESGDLAVMHFSKFIDGKLSKDAIPLIFKSLSRFATNLSDQAHSTLVEIVIPKLARLGYQKPVADFLMTLPMELAPIYLIDLDETILRTRLKAALLRLHYLADVQWNFTPKAEIECGIALFRIGEYDIAAKYFGLYQTSRRADVYKYLSMGMSAACSGNYSRAVTMFQHAREACNSLTFIHDFHNQYIQVLIGYYSICFQGRLLYQSYVDATNTTNSIKELLMVSDDFMNAVIDLPNSSLLLHPDIDAASRNLVLEFTERAQALVNAFGVDRAKFEELSTVVITPPECLLSVDAPISVENLAVSKTKLEITSDSERQMLLNLTGRIVNTTDLKLTISCEIDFNYEGRLHQAVTQKVAIRGDFDVPFPLLIEKCPRLSQLVKLTVTFRAETEDHSIYLIGYFYRTIQVYTQRPASIPA